MKESWPKDLPFFGVQKQLFFRLQNLHPCDVFLHFEDFVTASLLLCELFEHLYIAIRRSSATPIDTVETTDSEDTQQLQFQQWTLPHFCICTLDRLVPLLKVLNTSLISQFEAYYTKKLCETTEAGIQNRKLNAELKDAFFTGGE